MTDFGPSTARPLSFVAQCLGSGEYEVLIRARRTRSAPARTVGRVDYRSGEWAWRLNTQGSVSATAALRSCDDLFETLPTSMTRARADWRHEVWIYRDAKVVAIGVLLNITPDAEAGTVTFSGPDLSAWFGVRVFFHTMKPEGIDLALIFKAYFDYGLDKVLPEWGQVQEGDPPLIGDNPGITLAVTPTGVTGKRTVYHRDYKYVGDEMEELAKTGVDWTMIGRQMWAGGEVAAPDGGGGPLALPGMITDEFFSTPPRVRRTGEGMANVVGIRGNDQRIIMGEPDPDDGVLIERVLDEYSIEDEASARALGEGYLHRGRYENVYAEGDSNLAASAPVNLFTLVPGTRSYVNLSGGGVPYKGWLRLDSTTGSFGVGERGEVIRPTLQPIGSNADARGAGG